jgi:hypothetical protein
MVGDGNQAARRQNVDVGTGPGGFRSAGGGTDQPLALGIGADCRRQRTCDRRDRAVQRQLAEHDIGGESIARQGAECCHQPERNRQVVMAAFLGQVGRGKVDGDFLGRHRQAGRVQRRLHPLAAFGHRLVGQADDLHADLAGRDHHLHVDGNRLDALERDSAHARNHAALPIAPRSLGPHGCAVANSCTLLPAGGPSPA